MPKKQPFQKITNRELEIMQLLWNADHPLIASEIAAMKPDLTVNTVQSVLRNLLKHKYIEVAKIVYSGTVLTRSYRPLITEQDFGIDQVINDFHSFRGLCSFCVFYFQNNFRLIILRIRIIIFP